MKVPLRIQHIRTVPITTRERDLITGAERHLLTILRLPLVDFVQHIFPQVDSNVTRQSQQIWEYTLATFHLQQIGKRARDYWSTESIAEAAAQIYARESHRILGTLFPLVHPFWSTFYQRIENVEEQPLLALDVLFHHSIDTSVDAYQGLQETVMAILKAKYLHPSQQHQHLQIALHILRDLALPEFYHWTEQQLSQYLK